MPGVIEAQRARVFERVHTFEIGDYAQDVRWSRDGRFLAAASVSGPVVVVDATRPADLMHLAGHPFGTISIDWHPGGTQLASGGQDGRVRVWDVQRQTCDELWPGGPAWVERVAWSATGKYLAWAAGKKLFMKDVESNRLYDQLQAHDATVADIGWASGEDVAASAAYGGIRLWKPGCALPYREFFWQGSSLVLRWSPDDRFIATGDQDATVHFWFTGTGQDLRMWGFPGKVKLLSWSHTSRHLATASGSCIAVWDCHGKKGPEGRKPVLPQSSSPAPVSALAYQHQGPLLAAGYQDGHLALFNHNQTTDPLYAAQHPGDAVVQAAWSPDDERLAMGTASGHIVIYALIKRKES